MDDRDVGEDDEKGDENADKEDINDNVNTDDGFADKDDDISDNVNMDDGEFDEQREDDDERDDKVNPQKLEVEGNIGEGDERVRLENDDDNDDRDDDDDDDESLGDESYLSSL